MTRPLVAVREATPDDLPDLLVMWRELRRLGSRYERAIPQPTEEGVLSRLHLAHDDPRVRILVAVIGEEPVGMAVLTYQPFAALFDAYSVHVHYLHVREGSRRHGAGRALVAAAAAFAEEVGAEHVLTSVASQLRETQRFYARLGFAPAVVRRVAPVATLRRRLTADGHTRAGQDLLARRRSVVTRSRIREALLRVSD